jgi:phenylacetic acid degradation protein
VGTSASPPKSAPTGAIVNAPPAGDLFPVANIFEFEGFVPVVHESAYVHPNATVTGNVVIGRDVYVGPGAAIRGDWGGVVIEDGCNVQESCTVHMFPGVTVVLEEAAHVGHGAIVHGARIGRNALIGMNAVVMDHAVVGAGSIVGALCFVPSGMHIPERSLVVGNPGRVVKQVSDEMLAWKTEGTRLYQGLPARLRDALRPCEPLRERTPEQDALRERRAAEYRTWAETRAGGGRAGGGRAGDAAGD